MICQVMRTRTLGLRGLPEFWGAGVGRVFLADDHFVDCRQTESGIGVLML